MKLTGKITKRDDEKFLVFTPEKLAALGLAEDALPHGWWIGMKVTDTEAWQKIKNGDYQMFSIGGAAVREAVKNE